MKKHSPILVLALAAFAQVYVYAQDLNVPILPMQVWEIYDSEEEALAKAESGSLEEQRKAAVTFLIMSRNEKDKKQSLELARQSSDIINRIYRRNRNNILLALLSGMINLAVADKSSRLKDQISYTNRGLANYEFTLPNLPDNLEVRQMYLRTTYPIPTFFKNLAKEQLQRVKQFLDGYEAGLAKLPEGAARERLTMLKTHVLIIAAKISERKRGTRGDVPKYLAQVDTSFFPQMKKFGDGDLVEMYYALKK